MSKIKTIFIGTPAFAVPSFLALLKSGDFAPVAVITRPDKAAGRGLLARPTPIKAEALKHGLPVYQPEDIKDFDFSPFAVDLIVLAAYSQIIPDAVIEQPRYGVVNVHGSLLPRYRGAACLQWPIINGDKESGATIMKMDAGLDTGPIIAQRPVPIAADDTAGTLSDKIAALGADLLVPALKDYVGGRIKPWAQNEAEASYAGRIKKEDGRIDWNNSAAYIERFIRAMRPWPGAFARLEREGARPESVKFIRAGQVLDMEKYKAGEIFCFRKQLAVQCGRGALVIEELQLPGKKCLSGEQCLCGYRDIPGLVLK